RRRRHTSLSRDWSSDVGSSDLEALRVLAVLLNAAMPKASARIWESLGAREHLGPLAAQPVADAGIWGRLAPGARVTKGESLFPQIGSAPGRERGGQGERAGTVA